MAQIRTCYKVHILEQLIPEKQCGKKVSFRGSMRPDPALMDGTSRICLEALKLCAGIFLAEWDMLEKLPSVPNAGHPSRKRAGDVLIHSTKDSAASYPEFDERFPQTPSYTRRAVVADALGLVSSYVSNRRNWAKENPRTLGAEPVIGFPARYELTFYQQDRDMERLEEGIIGLRLYDGKTWGWHYFRIKPSEARYIRELAGCRKMLSSVVEKSHGKYLVRFCFEEKKDLVSDTDPLGYTILAVDLGINAAASWCVMTADGTVHAKGVIRHACEEGRLDHLVNRKRMYQQAGKKPKAVYRMVNAANRVLSISTAASIMEQAALYSVDCIVFEHLDKSGKKKGSRYKERIHRWRAIDVQARVELQAHRLGMRISRICAWGTSKLAFDGSGPVDRHSVYRLVHGKKRYNYSICRFRNGKVYNCDLSASMNIGARFFLREYAKLPGCPELPAVPQRTLSTLWEITGNLRQKENRQPAAA